MPTNRELRTGLVAASDRLREVNSPALAAYIEKVLAPRGWAALRATDTAGAAVDNLSVFMDKAARDQIVAAAAAAGNQVTDDVNEGYLMVLTGEYTPRKPIRARYGASVEKVNLNVTPALSLCQQVKEQTGMSAANVAADYLMHKYKAGPYAAGYAADSLPPGTVCNPQVPRTVRDEIRSRAAAAGNKVTDDVNEGWQKYLDGQFTPETLAWSDTSDMVNLRMNPNDDLHDKLRAVKGIRPLQVAIAYLLAKYDIDPGTGQ
ncbi:hypothetical protein [Streptomyces sp. BE133]|uniref:hypothetical protein n=1 Tax=Streptomyces sp. BE133 TaxID=3002523 RepID=UPI002E76385A|nr:hypothetical protein [Streptomyces sp. BE133]MEE1812682.1 hypothetical protein [Streptomyces sp. BE133]